MKMEMKMNVTLSRTVKRTLAGVVLSIVLVAGKGFLLEEHIQKAKFDGEEEPSEGGSWMQQGLREFRVELEKKMAPLVKWRNEYGVSLISVEEIDEVKKAYQDFLDASSDNSLELDEIAKRIDTKLRMYYATQNAWKLQDWIRSAMKKSNWSVVGPQLVEGMVRCGIKTGYPRIDIKSVESDIKKLMELYKTGHERSFKSRFNKVNLTNFAQTFERKLELVKYVLGTPSSLMQRLALKSYDKVIAKCVKYCIGNPESEVDPATFQSAIETMCNMRYLSNLPEEEQKKLQNAFSDFFNGLLAAKDYYKQMGPFDGGLMHKDVKGLWSAESLEGVAIDMDNATWIHETSDDEDDDLDGDNNKLAGKTELKNAGIKPFKVPTSGKEMRAMRTATRELKHKTQTKYAKLNTFSKHYQKRRVMAASPLAQVATYSETHWQGIIDYLEDAYKRAKNGYMNDNSDFKHQFFGNRRKGKNIVLPLFKRKLHQIWIKEYKLQEFPDRFLALLTKCMKFHAWQKYEITKSERRDYADTIKDVEDEIEAEREALFLMLRNVSVTKIQKAATKEMEQLPRTPGPF